MRTNLSLLLLVILVLPVGPGVAFPAIAPAVVPASAQIQMGNVSPEALPALSLGMEYVSRVRPRPYHPRMYGSPMSMMPVSAQIHGGFFYPTDNFSTGFDGGFRVGPQLDPHIQVGFAMDWWHRSQNEVMDLGTVRAPGGSASEELILSESSANLIPTLMFVQVNGGEELPVIPYGGIGVGYEWLFLSANDFRTGESFDETFGGFGWQAWGGVGLPLGPSVRLNGEIFFNGSEPASEVDVFLTGYGPVTVRDIINMNGIGMRLGLSWGF